MNAGAVGVSPLRHRALVGDDFVLVEWQDAGETSAERPIAPLHLHRADDEAWYVLEGALGFVRGEERLTAPAGSAVLVPRGTAHAYWNDSDGLTRYVLVMTPRIHRLVASLHLPENRGRFRELFEEHESELLA